MNCYELLQITLFCKKKSAKRIKIPKLNACIFANVESVTLTRYKMCPSSIILCMMRTALNSAGVVDWPLRLYHPDEVFEGYVLSGCGVLMHRMESKQSHHLTFIRNVLFYYIKCYICNADGCSWQSAGAHYVALGFVSSFLLSVFLPLFCSPSISFICPHTMFSVCPCSIRRVGLCHILRNCIWGRWILLLIYMTRRQAWPPPPHPPDTETHSLPIYTPIHTRVTRTRRLHILLFALKTYCWYFLSDDVQLTWLVCF